MQRLEPTWLGELGETEWCLALRPRRVLQLVEDNTTAPPNRGGPTFSVGSIVSFFDDHEFRLYVRVLFGPRHGPSLVLPRLVGHVRPDGDGSIVTFRIEFPAGPLGWLLWVPMACPVAILVFFGIVALFQGIANDGENLSDLVTCELCCVGLPVSLLSLAFGMGVYKARSHSACFLDLMTTIFREYRIPAAQWAPPSEPFETGTSD